MDDRFSTLREAVQTFLAQREMPTGDVLVEFRNAASVFTIDELLRAYDDASKALAQLTYSGPFGPLSPEEALLIAAYRTLGATGRRMVLAAAEASATIDSNESAKSADVIELHPRK